MTTEMWIIAVVRVLGSLLVLRWAFWGGIIAILVDQSDLFMMNLIHLGGVTDYQTFDKYLDQVYLGLFLVVALRWQGAERTIAIVLYLYRFVGFLAFELTHSRDVLLAFPNFFEFWFLFIAARHEFGSGQQVPLRLSRSVHGEERANTSLFVVLGVLIFLKLFQEYAIHYQRWLDGFTAVDAVKAIWHFVFGG